MRTPTRPLLASTIVLAVGRALLPGRRSLALLLAFLLFGQAIVPPSLASSRASVRSVTTAGPARSTAAGFTRPGTVTSAGGTFGVVLTALNTDFNNHTGIDYHQQSRSVVASANSPSGQPHNFELIDGNGAHRAFSNISNLGGALKIATARDDGQGASPGGFRKGDLFTGTGMPGVVARVAPDGVAVQNPWVTLTGEMGQPAGLHVDRTGVFGGDLIVVTDAGGVWRINAAGVAAPVASLSTPLSGVTTIPDDAARYGPWAGKILIGAKEQGAVYAVDAQGGATSYPLGLSPTEIELVPAHENFFGIDTGAGKLWGAPADAFTSLIGDVLVAQASPGVLARVRWNGTEFETGQIAQVAAWGQITFAPAGVAEIRGVKQVYDKIAVVRHAPVLNSGRVEGALWQLKAENVSLGGTDTITSDLLVPGSPTVTVGGGHPTFAGVIEGVENAQPTGYAVSIGANASLRHLITRTNPIELEPVAAPPSPAGTRNVAITKEGESVGDFSTLRNLSLSGKAGAVAVPPGTYGDFSLSGRTILVLGVENSTEPSVYNLQNLVLSGGSELRLAGPVAITVRNGVSLTGSTIGAADAPRRMLLKVAAGEVKVGGGGVLYGIVRAPQSLVEISGRSRVRGTVACDRLTVNGNGVLQITEKDIAPPPVNRPPTVDAGADQTVTLPTDTVSLNGTVSDDGLPQDGTLRVEWSVSSAPGSVNFTNPASAATTAAFTVPGVYVLKLTVSDGQLTRSDSVQVEVVPRNQPPTVDAGADLTIKLADSATLAATVTDDALPRGSTVNVQWSVSSGPGAVTFSSPERAETTASFTAPGIYVLRLTASDTEQTASDDVSVTVLPRPNRAPQITSTPVTEFTVDSATPVAGDLVNLTPWTVQQFGGGGAVWQQNASGDSVIQLHNSDPSMLLSDFNLSNGQMEGTWRVDTTSDDDHMGFVFGYQNSGQFYLFDWKQSDQPDGLGFAERGMSLKVFNASTPPDGADFWPTAGNGARVRTLYHNTIAWEDHTDYGFALQFRPGQIKIVVKQGDKVLADFTVSDATYVGGRFGFYNYSQERVQYSGFRRTSLAQGTYTYDVEATDPDGDALTYSLDAAPTGMTINPATGLISWPVTPGEAGEHNVVVRVTDPDGAFHTQSYTLRIIDPNKDIAFKVYTLNADFDQGSYINVTRAVGDQLQLDDKSRTLNFIWVAVSSKGTVVKLDTETGAVLGEYFTSPAGQPRNPSRTTVDQNGNVWAANRDGNSVLHIGLAENGQCVDRNNNGVIDTSKGYGDIRPWTNAGGADTDGGVKTAQDECILHYTRVGSSGTRHVSVNKDNDVWVSGTGGRRFDLIDGKTGLIKRSEPSVGYGGYGGLIDKNGVIWSSNYLLRWDTSKPLTGASGGNWRGYAHDSYGLCIDSKGNVWNTSVVGNQIHKFAPDGTLLGSFQHGDYWAQGCVVDKNDDVWVAHSFHVPTIGHLKNNGTFVGNIPLPSGPTGVAVDARGKIWTTNHYSLNVSRIDPNLGAIGADGVTRIGAVDFTSRELGGYLYNYSDMTGSTLTGAPDHGTWSTIFDSQTAGAQWGRIGWTAKVCGDGLLTVSVASSEDNISFNQPLVVSNGDDPEVPAGRYLKVTVRFERASSGESPVLYDLTVGTAELELETPTNVAPEVNAGTDQTINGILKTTLRGTACDDALPSNGKLALSWSKMSGPGTVTFTRPPSLTTEVTFGVAGTYELKLSASDSTSTSSDTVVVEVVPGNQPPTVNAGADQSVTHPNTAALNGSVTDDGLPKGSMLLVTWSKLSGPGSVTFSNLNAASTRARFGAPGTYVLRLTASDTEAAAHDEVTVTVSGENQPPIVNAGGDQTITLPNNATLDATATDDGWPQGSTLSVSWSQVSGPGNVTFANSNSAATQVSFSVDGIYVLRLTAGDSVYTASDEVTLTVNAAIPPPVVQLTSPVDGSNLTDRTNIIGSVSGGAWRLEYSLNSPTASQAWTTLASGNAPVTNGLLGVFDPTMLLNGSYTIRLVASGADGQMTVSTLSTLVTGELKVGMFTIAFTDLEVPVAGLPIMVTRTYDSRDKRTGDFGVGWWLGLRNVRVEKSQPLGDNWEQTVSGSFLPNYCLRPTKPSIVTVTLPDGTVYAFAMKPTPQCQQLAPVQFTNISFAQLPGDPATQGATLLALGGDNQAYFDGSAPGTGNLIDGDTLDIYNPTRFQLTTSDGTTLIVDERTGLQSLSDTNGNTLNVGPGGVIHSGGKSITFTRDAQNRITRITDPAGNQLNYAYDPNGDLVSVTDQDQRITSYTYNSSHGLLDIIDPLGRRGIRNEYDASGRLVAITDEAGKTIRLNFNPNSRQQIVTDRKGNITVYEFSETGKTLSITNAEGNVLRATYDQAGNRLTGTDLFGNTTTYTYDARGNILTMTDAQNRVVRFTYNERNQLTSMTDANGNTTASAYDAKGNLTSTTDPLGNTTTFTYSAAGQMLKHTDAAGHVSNFEYDSSGNLTKTIDPLGNSTRNTYDAVGNLTSQTDARGNATQFNVSAAGLVTSTVDALGHTSHNEYNAAGILSTGIDQLGRRTEFTSNFSGMALQATRPNGTSFNVQYDANGNVAQTSTTGGLSPTIEHNRMDAPTKITVAPGVSMTLDYDAAGRRTAISDPNGNTNTFQYNLLNKVTVQTDALGNQARFTYDAVGNLTSQTDPNGNTTTYTYDKANRRLRTTTPDGSFFENTYNALGQVSSERDALGNVNTFTYDDAGRLLTVTQAGGAVTRYEYDPNGNLISSTDANRRKTLLEYDALNRLIKKTFPDTSTELTTYDGAGNVTSTTDRAGKTTTYQHDNLNRLTLTRYSDGKTVAYAYTQTGKRDTITDARGVTDFDYDALGNVTKVRYPDGTSITYAYDLAGNRTAITTEDGSTLYSYDKNNRLVKVTDPRGLNTSYAYDAGGNVVRVNHPNGLVTSRIYDSGSQLTSITTTGPNSETVFHEAYTYDANGRRTRITRADGSVVEYAYDVQARLTSETYTDASGSVTRRTGYTYDAVGNRATLTDGVANSTLIYTYNATDELLSDGKHTFTYDANGNTISKTISSSTTQFAYDAKNQLTQATQPDGSSVSYAYDADGNRVRSIDGSGAVTNHFVDPTTPAPRVHVETNGSGQVVATYTYGLELISQRRNGVDSFYVHDAHGSVRALTDAAGSVTDRYAYDAFGQLMTSSGSTANSFRYAGEQHDAATDLYYLRARYYNPSAGRFMSMDRYQGRLSAPSSQHKYAYTENDPVNLIDPTGRVSLGEGRLAHQIIGRYYLEIWGDYWVSKGVLKASRAKQFLLMSYPPDGKGAYDRYVRTGTPGNTVGVPGAGRPDLRNYENGDVYEIKPLNPDGIKNALAEVQTYTTRLNIEEKGWAGGEGWRYGATSFMPPLMAFPYPGGYALGVVAPPLTFEGTIFYALGKKPGNDDESIAVASEQAKSLYKQLSPAAHPTVKPGILNVQKYGQTITNIVHLSIAISVAMQGRIALTPALKAAA